MFTPDNAMQTRCLAGLDTLIVPGSAHGLCVVLLHGFGADANDLFPLSQVVSAPPGTTWLVPHAPLEVPLGPHVTGRAWFPIDMMALQAAMSTGTFRNMAQEQPAQLRRSRDQVLALVQEYGVPLHRVVFAGFSQGAMVATACALQAPENPAGLAIFSGTLIDAALWRTQAPARTGVPFVQSHGSRDPLLDIAAARELYSLLKDAGLQGDFMGFAGEHELPMPVLDRFGALLRQWQTVVN